MPVIKRYPNRKLYDTEAKTYVTLDEITEMIRAGRDVHVIDHETGDDLTTLTLSQIILEQEKKTAGFLPRSLLTSLIRTGGDTLEQVLRTFHGSDDTPEEEPRAAESKSASKAASKSTVAKPVASKAALAQAAVDERIADMLNMLNVPTRRDVRQLQEQLAALSNRLDEMLEAQEAAATDDEQSPPSGASPDL